MSSDSRPTVVRHIGRECRPTEAFITHDPAPLPFPLPPDHNNVIVFPLNVAILCIVLTYVARNFFVTDH